MTTTTTETPAPVVLVLHHETDAEEGTTLTEWQCPCGSSEFRYEESHPSTRTQANNTAEGLVFHGDFEWYDGDDTPGVVCEGCDATVTVPETCAVDFS